MNNTLQLSLGPVLYYWTKKALLDFYAQMAQMPVQTIYLGEVAQHQVDLVGGISLKALETRPKRVARDGTRAETRVYVDPQDVQILAE